MAEHAVAILNGDAHDTAALFPMDGFYFDDALLVALGRHTLRHMLQRLKSNEDDILVVPIRRPMKIARASRRLISRGTGSSDHQIIICEGNYLLLRERPWDRLNVLFDLTVFVDVGEDELR
ncbi:hypothetical protein PMI09_02107 [Rhizobium sp. CF122]|uniref:hypothetical protein n=1 Tax=Rhizobium sp. CF122 TaxID=1144312 RepID=UPI000271CAB6|nr:hypothetical protein PMI09_02107 [Rhizobium sp. CF122]